MNDKSTNLTFRANIIIHGYAAAAYSAHTAIIPFSGPLIVDTIGLKTIKIAMTMSLENLFGRDFEEGALWSFGSVIDEMISGPTIGIGTQSNILSLLPGVGSLPNSVFVITLHEAIGWGLFLIFERGGNPTKMTKEELNVAFKEGAVRAQKGKEAYEKALNKLPLDARLEVEQLQEKIIADKNISPTEKQAISDSIIAIFEQYN